MIVYIWLFVQNLWEGTYHIVDGDGHSGMYSRPLLSQFAGWMPPVASSSIKTLIYCLPV